MMQRLSSRVDEAILLIAQDNVLKKLIIVGIDDGLREMLKLEETTDTLLFTDYIPKKIAEYIHDELDYAQGAKDFLEIMQTMRHVALKGRDSKEHLCQFRIVRDLPQGRSDIFRVIITFIDKKKQKSSIAETLKHSFVGHTTLDEMTTLPNAASLEKFIELSQSYIAQKTIAIAFVYVAIEIDSTIPTTQHYDILTHIGHVIKRNLRQDDVIGVMDIDALGMLLMDVNQSTVHLALNRIRMMLQHDPYPLPDGTSYHPVIRISCVLLNDKTTPQETIAMSKKLLADDPARDMVVYRDAYLMEKDHYS